MCVLSVSVSCAALFPECADECPSFLRHKMSVISPSVLRQNSIPVKKVISLRFSGSSWRWLV